VRLFAVTNINIVIILANRNYYYFMKLVLLTLVFACLCCIIRSFSPHWQILRTYIEKLAGIHQQLSVSWQELCRDLQKYMIEQQRTHREVTR
jgi:hypothetical protein